MVTRFAIVCLMSLLFGGGIAVLFSHALHKQQVVMQEGY